MWSFLLGFGGGVYVGTYFDCKPLIVQTRELVLQCVPERRHDEEEK